MSEPEDTYPNAGRASGYTDSSGNDVGENIINRVTELLIAPQTKMLQLTAQFDATSALQDQRFTYVLNQLSVFLEKEDQRHDALAASEDSTLKVLASVAHRLDEITSYVQQSVTLARKGIDIGEEALAIGQAAQATGLQALKVGREALVIAKANAAKTVKVEKAVIVLKKGQTLADRRLKEIEDKLDQGEHDRAELAEKLEQRHLEYNARLDEVIIRLDADEARLDRKRARIDALETEVHELVDRLAARERDKSKDDDVS